MAHYTLIQDEENGDVILCAVAQPEEDPDDLEFVENGKVFKISNEGILWRYPNVNPALGLTLENNDTGDGYVAFTR